MKPDTRTLALPFLLIAVGAGWLLTNIGVAPGIDWIWTLGLAVIGVLAFVLSGFDKFSLVIGPLFLLASGLSILRQADQLHVNVEVPILVIFAGVLLLAARSPAIPMPKWIVLEAKRSTPERAK